MNYAAIKLYDIANGVGVRVSLFVSGCTHNCRGCFNKEAQDFNYGNEFTKEVEDGILESLRPSYIKGLTLLGGEPFEPVNQKALVPFLKRVRDELPDKNIWVYSGYTYDIDLSEGGKAYCEVTDEMLSMTDVLVDGEFIEELYDISLRFKGSSNQRIIDVPASRQVGKVILWNK